LYTPALRAGALVREFLVAAAVLIVGMSVISLMQARAPAPNHAAARAARRRHRHVFFDIADNLQP